MGSLSDGWLRARDAGALKHFECSSLLNYRISFLETALRDIEIFDEKERDKTG